MQLNKEKLEEVYLNKLIDEANKEFTLDRKLAKEVAIKYANWQAEKMYSEEEVLEIIYKHTEDLLAGKKVTLEKWFEQFKKK